MNHSNQIFLSLRRRDSGRLAPHSPHTNNSLLNIDIWPWKWQLVFWPSVQGKATYFIFDIQSLSTWPWFTSMATTLIVVSMLSTCVDSDQPGPGWWWRQTLIGWWLQLRQQREDSRQTYQLSLTVLTRTDWLERRSPPQQARYNSQVSQNISLCFSFEKYQSFIYIFHPSLSCRWHISLIST